MTANRTRPSLFGLMVGVVIVAVAFAALRRPSPLWASIVYTSALLALCGSTALSLLPGRRRRFWVGFAVFGWVHLVLLFDFFGRVPGGRPCPPPPTLYEEGLIVLKRAIPIPQRTINSATLYLGKVQVISMTPVEQAGRSLVTLLMGLVGGTVARLGRSPGRDDEPLASRDADSRDEG